VVIAYGRLVILGGDQQRLHEQVITAGGTLKEGRFSRLNVGQVDQALAAALPDEVPESFQQRLVDLWPSHKDQLMRSLEVRMDNHTNGLQKALEDRCEKEVADITAILTELRQQILHELEDSGEKQLELFREQQREGAV
jgi:hypothetical protein